MPHCCQPSLEMTRVRFYNFITQNQRTAELTEHDRNCGAQGYQWYAKIRTMTRVKWDDSHTINTRLNEQYT